MPLFEAHPRLAERIPWLPIGHWPTPVTQALRFPIAHGLKALYFKREDRSHPECGGNKVRGLEFLLADAERRKVKTIIAFGTAGSHHVRVTAWHARRLGIDTVALVVRQPPAGYVRRNLLAGLAAGTRFVAVNYLTLAARLATGLVLSKCIRAGGRRYYTPSGGTCPLACLGHVNAALELKRQIEAGTLPEPNYLYVPLGSLGTAAGLALGCKLAGLRTRLVGVVVSYRWYCTPGRWGRLARRTHRLMQRLDPSVPDVGLDPSELCVVTTALGRGYARPTDESLEMASELHDAEHIELDSTYTAKTLTGVMAYIRRHRLQDQVHLFWHTYHALPELPDERDRIQSLPRPLRRYFADNDPARSAKVTLAKWPPGVAAGR